MENSKSIIKYAFRQLLAAIVRLAIRNGLSFVEFSNISKSLYVDIATREYGIKGRETNISRVSLMTGLDRKEIKRIREERECEADTAKRPDKIAAILSSWFASADYTDEYGQPLELVFEGDGISFSRLVKECGGGSLAPITVLREFKRSKVVEETGAGKLRALRKDFIPNYHVDDPERPPEMIDPDAIAHGSSMLVDHINTIFHNLYREDMGQSARLDMRATNTSVKVSKIKEFYSLVDKLGMKALDEIDEWLEKNEIAGDDLGSEAEAVVRLGLGVYSIEGENQTVKKRVEKPS